MRTAQWPCACPLLVSAFVAAQGTSNKDDSRDCFFPNGIQSSGSPCFPSQAVSPCCGPGFVCLSNGLCQPGPDTRRSYQYTVYRSSCTDRTWNSTSCPQICLGPSDRLDAGQGLATCGTGGSYCCGRGYDCCSNATDIFPYETAEVVTTIPYSSSSATSATSSVSATVSRSSSQASPSNAVAIGVGVGVGVGGFALLLASIIAFFLFRRRRGERGQQQHGSSRPSNDEEGNRPRGSELPTREMKDGRDVNSSATSPPPMYQFDAHPRSPFNVSGGEMVPGAPLNPAEFPSGPERERYEMEGDPHGDEQAMAVHSDGQKHELAG
ncbi:uncharacterized protein BKCO1_5500064 [Diplodia corticola]|uniref:Uncharacterized protein n=1 Tax=Diplodia corticola TaxID=236234 RepID=A0A1J9RQT6_9PEZI|nr:uncharacterized protein BKCO1_5500064 [Diplodia corticola]OJD30807.1 hypothetical protein BKCO1_5500064 [Diplodia corticola]